MERERGITVKAQSASLLYEYKGDQFLLNMIDTPGNNGALSIVKLREREGQGVDPGRSLKGHLWMVDGGWWYTFP